MDLQSSADQRHLASMLRRICFGFDVDIHARLEHWRTDLFNQGQHVLITVDDVGPMVLHREHDAVIIGNLAEFAHGFDHEPSTVALPESVLVVAVGIVVCGEAIMERDAAPCREDLADRGAQVVRQS